MHHLLSEDISGLKSRTLAPIFANRTSFSSKSKDDFFFFEHSFKVRDLFSFICFLKAFLRIFSSLSVSNQPWFSLLMHWFNKGTVSCKQKIFSEDALRSLLFKDSFLVQCQWCTFLSTAGSIQVCHYMRKRWTKKFTHTIFISVTFIYYIHFYRNFLSLSQICS